MRLPWTPHYPVRTQRLLLRPLDPDGDVDAVLAYQSRADVCRFVPYAPRTRAEVAARIADPVLASSELTAEGQVLNLAVVRQDTGQLIGDVVLILHSVQHGNAEIGYVINPDHAGNGYATEAARALLGLAFDGLGLRRIVARIDPRNEASAQVLRRLGMRQEAYLRENEWFKGGWADEADFAMLASEWRER